MFARTYLIIVALLYLVLAIWCSVQPTVTSRKVGFELIGGSGQSEFLTVYGGLEFGLALVLLASCFREPTVGYGVGACVLIHASLVLFRTIGFLLYTDMEPLTYRLAIGEWVIALWGMLVLWFAALGRRLAP